MGLSNGSCKSTIASSLYNDWTSLQVTIAIPDSVCYYALLCCQGSGCDEIVTCAWDGMTYVVDLNRNIVRYKFEQNVTAFAAGTCRTVPLLGNHPPAGCYGLEASNEPCLVYTTFSNRVYIYHNIQLPAVPSFNLVTARLDTEEGWDGES